MSSVTLEGVSKVFGDFTALKAVDLTIREGEFVTLLGPSGCGKTTTLRLIAGFTRPSSGRILLGKDDVTDTAPQHREIGMVFQDYALFPHLTIFENVAFPLRERRAPKAGIAPRVAEMLDLVRLPHIADRYPSELSGGQAQRVAVARAVAHPPRVLLMDEPLGALDLKLREVMQLELRRIQQELGITTVFVTHDQSEAMTMSDRIVVMNNGRIEQIGTAREIYRAPKNAFVADFVGRINLLDVTVDRMADGFASVRLAGGQAGRVRVDTPPQGTRFQLGIRPEHSRFLKPDEARPDENCIAGKVRTRAFNGNLTTYYVDTGHEKPLLVEQRPGDGVREQGEEVSVLWQPDAAILLPAEPTQGA